jgi:hypothetical protein
MGRASGWTAVTAQSSGGTSRGEAWRCELRGRGGGAATGGVAVGSWRRRNHGRRRCGAVATRENNDVTAVREDNGTAAAREDNGVAAARRRGGGAGGQRRGGGAEERRMGKKI